MSSPAATAAVSHVWRISFNTPTWPKLPSHGYTSGTTRTPNSASLLFGNSHCRCPGMLDVTVDVIELVRDDETLEVRVEVADVVREVVKEDVFEEETVVEPDVVTVLVYVDATVLVTDDVCEVV